MQAVLGTGRRRVEGAAKVTGAASYASDPPHGGEGGTIAHAALVTAAIARGRITGFDLNAANRVPGILAVFTHRDFAGAIASVKHLMAGGYVNSSHRPLGSDTVAYAGQIVALVVAETLEAAQAAAAAVRVSYAEIPAAASFDSPGADTVRLADLKPQHEDVRHGDTDAALTSAAHRIEARYETPIQHHNPIELFTTRCAWEGDRLIVHEPDSLRRRRAARPRGPARARSGRGAGGLRVARRAFRLEIRPVPVHRSGGVGRPQARPPGVAGPDPAAMLHHRQLSARDPSRHPPRRGRGGEADRPGARGRGGDLPLRSLRHGRGRRHREPLRLPGNPHGGACGAGGPQHAGPMRAPPEVPYLFALESAMDELAWQLGLDPIELRRRNDTTVDPVSGKPFSSRPSWPATRRARRPSAGSVGCRGWRRCVTAHGGSAWVAPPPCVR